jgi:hypothetical protein
MGGGAMKEESTSDAQPGPSGLGGWLSLVGFGLLLAPWTRLGFLVQTFPPIFSDGTWELLTTPGGEAYHPLWAPFLLGELVGNLAFIGAGLALILFFFLRSRRFPRLYIAVTIANLLFVLADAWLASIVVPDEPMFGPDTASEVGRSVVGALIWVPYMLASKRVKNTFVR